MEQSIMTERNEKVNNLLALLKSLENVVVGFSGGVDSTFLAAAAYKALGEKAVAITAYSETLSKHEEQEGISIAQEIGIRHVLLNISELNCADFVKNTSNRCYYCKKERFGALSKWAEENNFKWVLEGSNADDTADYRPGIKAVNELSGVRSPLLEIGFTKAEIRAVSEEWNLSTWDKLSAACLSSRVSYGLEVTAERLRQIELAEEFLRDFCTGPIRVRHHGELARIEVSPADIQVIAKSANAALISEFLKKLGFTFVTVDLAGYRSGSMNEVLKNI